MLQRIQRVTSLYCRIHDAQEGNELYDFANEQGEKMSRLQNYNSGTIYGQDNEKLPTVDWIRTYAALGEFRRNIDEFKKANTIDPSIPDVSLYEVYENFLESQNPPVGTIPSLNLMTQDRKSVV